MAAVRLVAPAKVTLTLRVTGVRGDGYHLIDAEMVTVDLHDTLELDPAGAGLEVLDLVGLPAPTTLDLRTASQPAAVARTAGDRPTGSGAAAEPTGTDVRVVPGDEDNLVAKALRLLDRTAHVRLTKRIPAGAGLGGGSADAAAVLRWAGHDDLEGAARLGADVAFCLVGGRARVRGIGEQVDPLPHVDRTLTLLTPPFGCSTPAVYRAWDDLGGPTADGPNDLEPAALAVEPRLTEWRDRLGNATGATPVLAGSGSTWFVEGAFPDVPGAVVAGTVPPAWTG